MLTCYAGNWENYALHHSLSARSLNYKLGLNNTGVVIGAILGRQTSHHPSLNWERRKDQQGAFKKHSMGKQTSSWLWNHPLGSCKLFHCYSFMSALQRKVKCKLGLDRFWRDRLMIALTSTKSFIWYPLAVMLPAHKAQNCTLTNQFGKEWDTGQERDFYAFNWAWCTDGIIQRAALGSFQR